MGRLTRSRAAHVRDRRAQLDEVDGLVVVRSGQRSDLPFTAAIHQRWLATGFFPRLGARFLRTYHASFAASPHAVLIVARTANGTTGFLAGTLDNERHYRWLVRHRGVVLAARGAGGLLRDGALLREFGRTRARRYLRGLLRRLRRRPVVVTARCEPASTSSAPDGPIAVLTHVAVAPDARGTGTGRQLVDTFEQLARAAGAHEARLITQVDGAAPAFYRALDWRTVGVRAASDGSMVEEFRRSLVDRGG